MSNVAEIEGGIRAKGLATPDPPVLASRAFTADELGPGDPPPRPWHVPNMVPGRAVTLLQGDGGTGKSVLALQLAASTVLGRPWLGQDVRKGNALYLSAEDDRDEIHRRLSAITLDHGLALDSLPGLKILDLCGQDAVMAEADRSGRLHPTDRWAQFADLARGWEPALIALDNLADVFAGEENSRPQARQFIGLLQGLAADLGAAIVLIGHPSLAGMASGTGSSGSTAWNNSVRSRLYLTRPATDDGEPASPDARVLTVKKANYGPANGDMRLRWVAGAFRPEDEASPTMGPVDRQIAEERVERVFLDLLAAFAAEGRRVSEVKCSTYAPAAFATDPRAGGITRKGFAAAMARLFAAGEIVVETSGPPSKQRRHLRRRQTTRPTSSDAVQ